MAFKVIIHPKAAKYLEKLPKYIADRIVKKLEEVSQNPRRYTETLVGMDEYKIRAGEYRIFVGITHNLNIIEVYSVKHRSEAYKKK